MSRVRRIMFIASIAALLWSALVALTGGFYVRAGSVRVSSRDYRDALLAAVLAALAGLALTWWLDGTAPFRRAWLSLERRARAGCRAAAAVVAAAGSWLADAAADARREPWLALAPAIAVAIAGTASAIVQWADAPPLWLDEEMILLNVRDRSWSGLGGALWLGQSAPLAWLALERAALAGLGTDEAALRLVPVLFGLGTIVVALWIGRRWLTALGSAVLVLLCAFAPYISHYLFETKHYSADTFWALLLPALAARAVEGDGAAAARRSFTWWIAAAAGQWLANGATLVTPGCALFLAASAWRRGGLRAAIPVVAGGAVWLAAFGLHYQAALRFTHESEYLRDYWAAALPRSSSGLVDRARWVFDRLDALAANPAGTSWWKSLWICAALGLALGRRRTLALAFATVPPAAFVLAGLRLVPLHERFSLWIVPSLYVGLALAMDSGVRAIRHAHRRRRWSPAIAVMPLLIVTGIVTADIHANGVAGIAVARTSGSKHSLNDRVAVQWLMARLRPGDALLTTRLGWPAVWWYGDISIANADSSGVVRHAGAALLEVTHAAESECSEADLRAALKEHQRVLVYVGFPDYPPGFEYLLLHTLDRIGAIVAFSTYSTRGIAAVIDLRDPAGSDLTLDFSSPAAGNGNRLGGCVGFRAARRW